MKNPNGTGTVTKLSGKRRKPWVVKVTVGFDKTTGKQVQKSLGTFETRSEALKQLAFYNTAKEHEDVAKIVDAFKLKNIQVRAREKHTFEECYWAAFEQEKDKRSGAWVRGRKAYFRYFDSIAKKDINDVNLFMLQNIIDENKQFSIHTLKNMKACLSMAFKYAVICDWLPQDRDFTSYIKIESSDFVPEREHVPFTKDELEQLKRDRTMASKIILVYVFTGCRATELMNVERHDGYIVCGVKTENGINRQIPIHSFIEPFIDEVLDFLAITTYNTIRLRFFQYPFDSGIKHSPHDARYTFATLANECGMKLSARQKILGHARNNITEDVYTQESIEFLKSEIEKIQI